MKSNRRSFLAKAAALGSLAAIPSVVLSKDKEQPQTPVTPLPSLKGKKILFTHGGWDGHEPQKYVEYMGPWLKEEGAEVQFSDNLEPYADADLMANIDLVIQIFTMSRITPQQERGLLNAVRNGMGITGWHGGLCDAFRQNTEYQFMTGGQWVAHPGNVIDYEVNIIDQQDPVTAGLKDFPMHSEQYYVHVDPNVKVLATTTFNGAHNDWIDGCVVPVTWKKTYGKGRIFYTSVGHNLAHLVAQPDAVEMMKRGIRWASASKYEPTEKWVSPIYAKRG